jgi:glucosamine--fructose-6-phosphate aminotransferase (isomerizing)|uniref:glutamine--fructose-6-phosphate transaminase (isomerizing) n=1 Tax=viral metagenome TaxID=1070528 RepID=A0A6C0CC86_9ZZZZ
MCGITFIYSKKTKNSLKHIFNSLELIQNRGYDSIGICYYNDFTSKFEVIKKASTLKYDCFDLVQSLYETNDLQQQQVYNQQLFSRIALGHTRWATHGGKTDANAHPHISQHKQIILVHNGIINNFMEIKEFLQSKNYNFYSDTDSEVIANLIEYYIIVMECTIEEAIKKTLSQLEGTWALVIIYTKQLDTYYVTRKGSPLLLGYNNDFIICTSETNGFAGLISEYIPLKDNNIIKISNASYTNLINNMSLSVDIEKNKPDALVDLSNYTIKKVCYENIVENKGNYSHWMLKEIMEQPETLQKAYNYGGRINNNIIKLGGLDNISNIIKYIEFIYIIGCGTSYHASLIGELYLNEIKQFICVKSVNACEFNENILPNIKNYSTSLCIFLSQSGETMDVYNCLKICKSKKCLTLGIINKVDSLIAREVDCGIYMNAGTEISVASTKSFTSMLIILSLLSMWFVNNDYYSNNNKIDNLRILPNSVRQLLYDINFMNKICILKDFIINNCVTSIFILGKDKLYPIACEGALKIKEVCYIHCEGFSASSLKHGPFALLTSSNLTLLLIDIHNTKDLNNLKSTYYEIIARETNIFVITNSQTVIDDLKLSEDKFILLVNLDYYNEILYIITLQKLAYEVSLGKHINPDKPRNLAKVVSVE